ncbi:MAG: sulfite exporter TauE/SafE family protein [Clostridia bacterium]|nr:sulfite exporter TauE/SafE family protein [Clostridia bacterium]NCC43622.1 sulfite exporter TauE/SafE family protein [Clostridia bacterium]
MCDRISLKYSICINTADIYKNSRKKRKGKMTAGKLLFVFILFAVNIIQAVAGFAGPLLAMPVGIVLVGVEDAKAVVTAIAWLSSAIVAVRFYKQINIKELVKIICLMLVGMVAGIWLFKRLPMEPLLICYGVVVMAIGLKKLFIKKELLVPSWMMIFVLLLAGMMQGLFTSGGAFLVVYAVTKLKDKGEFRATISGVWAIINIFLLFSHWQNGFFTRGATMVTLWAILPVLAGVWIGNKLHNRINQGLFMKIAYVLLILSGLLLLI